jgi:hypothetical protein
MCVRFNDTTIRKHFNPDLFDLERLFIGIHQTIRYVYDTGREGSGIKGGVLEQLVAASGGNQFFTVKNGKGYDLFYKIEFNGIVYGIRRAEVKSLIKMDQSRIYQTNEITLLNASPPKPGKEPKKYKALASIIFLIGTDWDNVTFGVAPISAATRGIIHKEQGGDIKTKIDRNYIYYLGPETPVSKDDPRVLMVELGEVANPPFLYDERYWKKQNRIYTRD